MGNSVDIEVNADVAQAVAQLSKVIKKQGEITKGLTEQTRKSRKAAKAGRAMGKSFATSLKSVAGSMLAFAGVTSIFGGVKTSMAEARAETILFEEEITDLLSLGNNIQNIESLKREVIAYSSAWGIARAEVAKSMFDIQSGASNLSQEMRDSIRKEALELIKVTGTDLPTATQVMVKGWNIYGDTLKDVNQLQNKLFKTADIGAMTFTDLGTLLPDVASAAKAFGNDLDIVLAALATATQTGGKNEKTFTGIRNVFLRMSKAVDEGVVTTKNFTDQIDELSQVDADVLNKIFGAEAISVIASLVDNTDKLKNNLKDIEDVSGDLARSKFLTRLKDESFVYKEINKSIDQQIQNAKLGDQYVKNFGGSDVAGGLAEAGFRENTPQFASFLAPVMKWLGSVSEYTGLESGLAGPFKEAGQQRFLQNLYTTGRTEEANYASLYLDRGQEAADKWLSQQTASNGEGGKEAAAGKLDAAAEIIKSAGNDLRNSGSQPVGRPINRGE